MSDIVSLSPADLASKLISLDLDKKLDLQVSRRGSLRIEAKAIRDDANALTAICGELPPDDRNGLLDGVSSRDSMSPEYAAAFAEQLKKKLLSKSVTEKREAVSAEIAAMKFNGMDRAIGDLDLILNFKSMRDSFLYDPATDRHYSDIISFDTLKDALESRFGPKGFNAYKLEFGRHCLVEYRPLKPRMFLDTDKGVEVFNTWRESEWAVGWKPGDDPVSTPPGLFSTLLDMLVPGGKDRHMLQAWLRDCVFGIADPVLVLCGVPGTGKNLFAEILGSALVGIDNFSAAQRGFSRTTFHSNVSGCRLFILDETDLTFSLKNTLKSYHNRKHASIERKGKDVKRTEEIFASFVLMNNYQNCIALEHEDRKFYVPDLNPKTMVEILGEKGAEEFYFDFVDACKTPEFLREVAGYLYANFSEKEANKFDKNTENFLDICRNSFSPWLKHLKDLHEKMSEDDSPILSAKEVFRGIKKKPDTFSEALIEIEKYITSTGDRFISPFMHSDGSWSIEFNPGEVSMSNGHTQVEELAL